MFRKLLFIVLLIPITFLFSCVATKTATTAVKSDGSAESYIETYKGLAISEMKRTGVPASITLAQGMIESDSAGADWPLRQITILELNVMTTGQALLSDIMTTEGTNASENTGKWRNRFRTILIFSEQRARYGSLFELESTDYKGWARGLKKAGYATNPDYANMLIRKIEQYNLTDYDRGRIYSERPEKEKPVVANKTADTVAAVIDPSVKQLDMGTVYRSLPSRVKENNRIQYIIVKDKDTKKSLEAEFQLLPWELQRYNELNADFTLTPGQMLYLQPKRDKADVGNDYHVVRDGETMYSISQIYGIKLNKLLLMNRMAQETEPATGQKLWLRMVKPVN